MVEKLMQRDFEELIVELDGRARRLAGTALLLRDVWRVRPDTAFDQLAMAFGDPELRDLAPELRDAFAAPAPGAETEERAYHAAWSYERLMAVLRRYAE
jgi:hypothetical protein